MEDVTKTILGMPRRVWWSGFLVGIAAGAVAGGLAMLFLAPKSGPETRQMIADKATQAEQAVKDRITGIKDRAVRVRDNMRSSAEREVLSAEKS
jgi:gas vesicle protein